MIEWSKEVRLIEVSLSDNLDRSDRYSRLKLVYLIARESSTSGGVLFVYNYFSVVNVFKVDISEERNLSLELVAQVYIGLDTMDGKE